MNALLALDIYFVVVGAWATATKRRWVFLTTFITATLSILIVGFMFKIFTTTSVSFWGLFRILIGGFCFELFLYQICVLKKFASKILMSFAAGLILASIVAGEILVVIIQVLRGNLDYPDAVSAFIYYVLSFTGCLLLSSYVGVGLSNILKKIKPNMFDAY